MAKKKLPSRNKEFTMVGGRDGVSLYVAVDKKKLAAEVCFRGVEHGMFDSKFMAERKPFKCRSNKVVLKLKSTRLGNFFQGREDPTEFMLMWGFPLRAVENMDLFLRVDDKVIEAEKK